MRVQRAEPAYTDTRAQSQTKYAINRPRKKRRLWVGEVRIQETEIQLIQIFGGGGEGFPP